MIPTKERAQELLKSLASARGGLICSLYLPRYQTDLSFRLYLYSGTLQKSLEDIVNTLWADGPGEMAMLDLMVEDIDGLYAKFQSDGWTATGTHNLLFRTIREILREMCEK